MATWQVLLEPLPQGVKVLVTHEGNELLKARLLSDPDHPRALLTMLEGLALWAGEKLCVAISADVPSSHSLGLGPFTDDPDVWPEESALIGYVFVCPHRRRRLPGLGDFSKLRRLGLYR